MAKWKEIPTTPSPEAIVKAALERAAEEVGDWGRLISGSEDVACEVINDIVTLADNPAEVTAIIKKAGETND